MNERIIECHVCLFCEKGKCVWYERAVDDKGLLCGAVHFEPKGGLQKEEV